MKKQIELPPYPTGAGPAMARSSETYRGTYQRYIAQLRSEMQRTEEAFAEALARADAASSTRSRIDALAKSNRTRGGR